MGVYTAVVSSGAALGQTVGGVLVNADLFGCSWRPAFLVNVPIGIVLLVVAPRVLAADRPAPHERGRGLDLPGLIALAAAVTLCTVPLVLGRQEGWPLWGRLCLGLGAVLLAVFARLEVRLARRGGAPLITPRVLRLPGMVRWVVLITLAMSVNAGLLFAQALHLQSGLGFSALRTGLTFAVAAVTFGLTGLYWRRLPPATWPYLAAVGLVLAAAAFAVLGLALRGGGDGGPWLYVGLLAVGAGLALPYCSGLTLALSKVAPSDAPDASGLLTTMTQLGQVVGVATLGTFFLDRLGSATGRLPSAHAFAATLAVLAAVCLAGGLLALVRPRRGPRPDRAA
jgi:hypothetical protein